MCSLGTSIPKLVLESNLRIRVESTSGLAGGHGLWIVHAQWTYKMMVKGIVSVAAMTKKLKPGVMCLVAG